MEIRVIGADECVVSRWSGGTTTQLAISPEGAQYADRDFLWRVSSAVVELPESDFTPLPDYDRILMILEGELSLSHNGGEEYVLRALEQTVFDGADRTFSRGRVTDFNLMMRKGVCTGRVEAWTLRDEAAEMSLSGAYRDHLLYCARGRTEIMCAGERYHLSAGETLLIGGTCAAVACTFGGNGTLIMAEMQ